MICGALLMLAACGREGAPLTTASPTPEPEATSTPEATESPTPEPTDTPSPSPSASPSPTATAAACRNSTAPVCGAFRFDPAIADDDQIHVEVTYRPRDPNPGDEVEFDLRATDPDSKLVYLGTYRFSSDGPGVVADDFPGECPRAYGPWDAPDDSEGSIRKMLRYTYREPGTYRALFTFYSHSYTDDDHPWPDRPPGDEDGLCVDPLSSSGKITVTIRVS